MKAKLSCKSIIIAICIVFITQQTNAQDLEVMGKAKITVMDQYNTADNLVIQLPDGTLGVRQASSLSGSTGS